MHSHSIDDFRHSHVFLGSKKNERKTWAVIGICAAMMVTEILGGWWFGSVALIAGGMHMSTHAGALLIAALAYSYSRRYAHDERLAFGTGKLGDLAAFTSAIDLSMIALLIGYESIERLFSPVPIVFNEAIPIAALGLGVNLLSAYLLHDDHGHHHGHGHGHTHHHDAHDHDHHDHHYKHRAHHDHRHGDAAFHADHNLRAAFVHVVADAAVSVLVIVGLALARQFGWLFMDPLMELVATVVILSWSWTLIRSSGAVLIDVPADPGLARRIANLIEQKGRPHFRSTPLAGWTWSLGSGRLCRIG
jgi:cation diffusion facilitator family transporter